MATKTESVNSEPWLIPWIGNLAPALLIEFVVCPLTGCCEAREQCLIEFNLTRTIDRASAHEAYAKTCSSQYILKVEVVLVRFAILDVRIRAFNEGERVRRTRLEDRKARGGQNQRGERALQGGLAVL